MRLDEHREAQGFSYLCRRYHSRIARIDLGKALSMTLKRINPRIGSDELLLATVLKSKNDIVSR